MADLKITDLVDERQFTLLQQLSEEISSVKTVYVDVARELAKGLQINVSVVGDVENLNNILVVNSQRAAEATERLTNVTQQRNAVLAQTTAAIARELTEIEKEEAKTRQNTSASKDAIAIAQQVLGTREQNIARLARISAELSKVAEEQKKLTQAEKAGEITTQQAMERRALLIEQERTLKAAKQDLTKTMSIEEKMNQAAVNSYEHKSQTLEFMKRAYKQLNDEERNSDAGKALIDEIQALDSHLKDLAQSQGEHQRNVGNYAIASQRAVVATEDIERALHTEARTIEEAQEQNKLLAKAINQVDLTSDRASDEIEEYSQKIEENNKVIKQAKSESESLVDSMADLFGINTNVGRSFEGLSQNASGNFFDGMGIKVKAFGKTLMGLLSNPYVLAFLGIAGTIAAAKWWYDYNKGLVAATKLTKDFTGANGDDLKRYRNEVQAIADTYDKDFKETIISTNALAKQFGISFDEALKLIKDGFVSGADANGEFLENVKEYPAYFKEAGLSASEFIAITTQANTAGIYSDKAIDVIKEGNLRIREMTSATAEALDNIGISSAKVREDLENGSKTTFDIMQEISAKLAEFPESSSAVGTALADIFGGPGEDAGLQYILTLKDIEKNMDSVKAKAGKLAELQEEQLESEIELQNTISALFDFTGGSFEELTTKSKTFLNDGLSAIIRGAIDLINYFIDLYNNSALVRGIWMTISTNFKITLKAIGNLFEYFIDIVKGVGHALQGTFTLDWDLFKKGLEETATALPKMIKAQVKNAGDIYKKAIDEFNDEVKPITIPVEYDATIEKTEVTKDVDPDKKKPVVSTKEKEERKKIIEALMQSEIDAMEDGYIKEIATIRANYAKRLSEIKGNSEEEKRLRANIIKQRNKELDDYEKAYNEQSIRLQTSNRLEMVKKGSAEELKLKLQLLELDKNAELDAAEKNGIPKAQIVKKYNHLEQELRQEHAAACATILMEQYSAEQAIRDVKYNEELATLKSQYAEKLKLAESEKEKLLLTEQYENDKARITEEYARATAEASIAAIEKQLAVEGLSVAEREKLNNALANAKIDLASITADAEIEAMKRTEAADNKLRDKRIANAKKYLQVASDAIGAISELASTMFDAEIEKLEEKQEANDEAYERDVERIDTLIEQGVISEEEGEARKREAKQKTEQKNEELEKKKNELAYKQAVWNKASQLAQTGIATARDIMEAYAQAGPFAGAVMAAIVGALGAIQAATIIATPIPKYARGTDKEGHKGGLAIVGDGGKQEVVVFGGQAWITPDTDTIVDLPKGAMVYPDINDFDFTTLTPKNDNTPNVVVNNDYGTLEKNVGKTNELLKKNIGLQYRMTTKRTFTTYKVA
ncbi:MAG: hypothetical protein IKA41_02445 [Bacteroidaceae bacterium]|nr:hypothetical protein [Bacteroidaceae bacterium]